MYFQFALIAAMFLNVLPTAALAEDLDAYKPAPDVLVPGSALVTQRELRLPAGSRFVIFTEEQLSAARTIPNTRPGAVFCFLKRAGSLEGDDTIGSLRRLEVGTATVGPVYTIFPLAGDARVEYLACRNSGHQEPPSMHTVEQALGAQFKRLGPSKSVTQSDLQDFKQAAPGEATASGLARQAFPAPDAVSVR